MNFKKLITIIAAGFTSLCALAQGNVTSPALTDSTDRNFGKLPVPTMRTTDSPVIDTLDTVNEYIKVILFSDNTWQYMVSEKFSQDSDVFNEAWQHQNSDPYRIPLDSLDKAWSIWVCDSLTQYCCPYVGQVYFRGKFGMRRGRRHQGVDLPYPTGTPVHATFDGKVRIAKVLGAYGNLIVIRHPNGLETFYGHLSRIDVKEDDWVSAGQVIGLGGSTGRSTGPHLHFETRYKGYAFDPQWLIDFKTGTLRQRLFVLKQKYFSPYSNYEQNFDDEIANEEEDKKADAEEAAKAYYKVKSGDTLSAIAARNHTTVANICKLNGIKSTTILQIGKTLRVR
ncbi:MAG: peptidoglycan DD-metalloendopeptidase family protein [Bacteroidales bacterium]|nr:peptidoglycan DD-metalloendopeptidase family protein [Bacteroidales bacterium]